MATSQSFLFKLLFVCIVVAHNRPITECERNHLGWPRLNETFSDSQRITICDKRFRGGSIYKKLKKKYSKIDCYLNVQTNELYSCRLHNLYGTFFEYANVFRFTAYCVIAKETKKYLKSSVTFEDKHIQNLKHFFQLLNIEIDEINPPPMYLKSYINIINQKVWHYDFNAITMCTSSIHNMPNYAMNPLHCLSALSLLFEYQYLLKERRQNSILSAVRYPKDMIETALILPYFSEIYGFEEIAQFGDGEEVYIKELRVNQKSWIKHSLFVDTAAYKKCESGISPILMDMADVAKNYWNERILENEKRDWLYLIDEMDGFEIYTKFGCSSLNDAYFESLNALNIVFISSQYRDGDCAVDKCVAMDVYVEKYVQDILLENKGHLGIDVLIVGNPNSLSHKLQYLLFRNVNILVGAYDPLFSIAALFMETDSVIFEIGTGGVLSIEHLAAMTGKTYYSLNDTYPLVQSL